MIDPLPADDDADIVCDRCGEACAWASADGLCEGCEQAIEEQREREYRGPPRCLD